MRRTEKLSREITRRDFLQTASWAPALLLPAPFRTNGLVPFLSRPFQVPITEFALADLRLTPHYPAKSPLDEVLRRVEPGADAYINEKNALEISTRLRQWSERLRQRAPALDALARLASSTIQYGSFSPSQTVTFRSSSGIDAFRRKFATSLAAGRERFLQDISKYFEDLSRIHTADFEITKIADLPSDPGVLDVEIRYEFVGETTAGQAEQRVGYWNTEWTNHGADGWQALKWQATEETVTRARGPFFLDVSEHALESIPSYRDQLLHGVDYWRTVLDGACGIDIYGNNGVAAGDFDNDGFDDLYICQPPGLPNRLYRNRGDGTFEDVTQKADVGVLDGTASALFADFQNRGLQDLLVVCGSGPLLFLNQGNGTFALKRDAFQFAQPPQGTFTHAAASDYDGDGRLDLYFCLYSYYIGLEQYHYPAPYFDARNGPPNFLLHNEGNASFVDRTQAAGLNAENDRYSFACAWGDFTGNRSPDLYVANDFGRGNLYRNDGGGKFTAISSQSGAADVGAGMSACWFDADGDGRQDIYVSNMWSAAGLRVSAQSRFHEGEPETIRALYRQHASGNALYHNRGDSTFENISPNAGLAIGRWAWSADSWDFDHDGYPDLYIANGYISDPQSSASSRADLASFFWRQVVANSPQTQTPAGKYELGWNAINELIRSDSSWNGYERNLCYANNHDGTFSDVSGIVGLDFREDCRAFALADLDHDGRLEVVLKSRNSPQIRIVHNASSELGHSVSFKLRGTRSNRDAIGAAVTVEAGGHKQTKYLQAGTGFLSQHSKELFFGLGNVEGAVRATIRWPSGLTQVFDGVPANHRIQIEEGNAQIKSEAFAATAFRHSEGRKQPEPSRETLPETAGTWLLEPFPAPDFSLPEATGKTIELRSYRGKAVLLNFCAPKDAASAAQLRDLESHHSSLEAKGASVIAITVNAPNSEAKAISPVAHELLPFPLVSATPEFAGTYNVIFRYLFDRRRDLPLPATFLLDADGKIVKVYQGRIPPSRVVSDLNAMPRTEAQRARVGLPFEGKLYLDEFVRNDFTFGVALFQHGYLDQAAESFRQVITAKPKDAEAYYNLGTLYLRKNSLSEAQEYLEQTVKLNPEYAEAWNNLGMIAGQQGNNEQAARYFQRCLQIRPDYVIVLLNLGNLYRRQGAASDAKQLLDHALEVEPENAEANYSLGMLYAQAKQTAEAASYLQKAVDLRPDFPDALNNLGILLVREEKLPEAREKFEACIRVAPNYDQAYLNLARLYVLLNDKEKARETLQALLRQQPNHKLAQQALEMLN